MLEHRNVLGDATGLLCYRIGVHLLGWGSIDTLFCSVQCPEFGAFNKAHIGAELASLDGALSDGRAFIAGEALTSADINAVCTLDFAKMALKVKVDAGTTPHLSRWYDAMKSRPSYKA